MAVRRVSALFCYATLEAPGRWWNGWHGVLVFPAASRPSIKSRISLDPKILFIIFDIEAPMLSVCRYAVSMVV